jgi:hypothetical protein
MKLQRLKNQTKQSLNYLVKIGDTYYWVLNHSYFIQQCDFGLIFDTDNKIIKKIIMSTTKAKIFDYIYE